MSCFTSDRFKNAINDFLDLRLEKLTDIPGQFKTLINEKGNKHVFMTDTIAELCVQSGIDQAGLEETLDRYNGYCDNGEDEEYE